MGLFWISDDALDPIIGVIGDVGGFLDLDWMVVRFGGFGYFLCVEVVIFAKSLHNFAMIEGFGGFLDLDWVDY